MKFRFCGDADCPNWLLMQVNTLSSMAAHPTLFEEICHLIATGLETGRDLDYNDLKRLGTKLNLDMAELKACTSGISFILRSATCYGVPSTDLGTELAQLGLEPILASALALVYSEHADALHKSAKEAVLRPKTASDISVTGTADGVRVDIEMNQNRIGVTMSRDEGLLLLQEMKLVQDKMVQLDAET